jgi:hypothetical protein
MRDDWEQAQQDILDFAQGNTPSLDAQISSSIADNLAAAAEEAKTIMRAADDEWIVAIDSMTIEDLERMGMWHQD